MAWPILRADVRAARALGPLVVAAVAALLCGGAPAAADIVYVYDDLGRLVAVTDPAAGTARFHYDGVGNLLAIERLAANAVSIVEFRPKRGPSGTTVTVQGLGFGATPGANTVTVNGTPATVTAASPHELTITIPPGATTGPIGVTAPGGSATSAASFEVTADAGAPTIASFSPTVGTAGVAVTVSGTNYETTPANNRLAFNVTRRQLASVTAATATSLATSVPGKR